MDRRTLLGSLGAAALAGSLPRAAQAANSLPVEAPIHVGHVGLRVRDAEALSTWYQQALGLREIGRDGATIRLGAGGETLLTLTQHEGLSLAGPRAAGLFHTAFLLPTRRDLAMWIAMAIDQRVPVTGTADHRVSEAIYLTDPEGNGVEIYADRPQDSWQWVDGQVQMGTFAMDVDGIMGTLGLLPPSWRGAPAGTRVGHVHMKVGNARQAGRWWRETLGFDAVNARDDAVFLSTGGYHHHVAVNEWMSAGAGRRSDRETGLDSVDLLRRTPGETRRYEDDWGTTITLT
ncbi:VOC family protein [Maritimibacter alkaliphilus]|uniref:VOC family protein n=1 Tax=Maritimibacter alkaliphilus TaxID=404236 RepID=UPI001C943B25|nr:VOC family protein [Maritimibacter alkaliphilus]MBY6090901.1 VOC family protein [Maritimibacter alkaliphilus]